MSDYTDEFRESLDARIEELEKEVGRLRAARVALGGAPLPIISRPNSGRPARRTSRRSREDSAERALTYITANPGVAGSKLGPELGLSLSAGYRVLGKLRDEGLIVEQPGGGWASAVSTEETHSASA